MCFRCCKLGEGRSACRLVNVRKKACFFPQKKAKKKEARFAKFSFLTTH